MKETEPNSCLKVVSYKWVGELQIAIKLESVFKSLRGNGKHLPFFTGIQVLGFKFIVLDREVNLCDHVPSLVEDRRWGIIESMVKI